MARLGFASTTSVPLDCLVCVCNETSEREVCVVVVCFAFECEFCAGSIVGERGACVERGVATRVTGGGCDVRSGLVDTRFTEGCCDVGSGLSALLCEASMCALLWCDVTREGLDTQSEETKEEQSEETKEEQSEETKEEE